LAGSQKDLFIGRARGALEFSLQPAQEMLVTVVSFGEFGVKSAAQFGLLLPRQVCGEFGETSTPEAIRSKMALPRMKTISRGSFF